MKQFINTVIKKAVMNAVLKFIPFILVPSLIHGGDNSPLEIKAIGRPFTLGMLYDAKSERIIPGKSLWNNYELTNITNKRSQQYSKVSFSATNTVSERSSSISMNGNMALSIYAGLITTNGFANFLMDSSSTSKISRVSMSYKSTSHFEELTMDTLNHITYNSAYDDDYATHVVTAILYGNEALFEFFSTYSSSSDKLVIEGELTAAVNKIPSLTVEGTGSMELSSTETETSENITVKFYGDLITKYNPTTYNDAVNIFTLLPEITSEETNAVPITVWLYPINHFNTDAAKNLIDSISDEAVNSCESLLEELNSAYQKCNDVLTDLGGFFPNIYADVESFREYLNLYKTNYISSLATILTEVRAGTKDSTDILALNAERDLTYFNTKDLEIIVTSYEILATVLTTFTNQLTGILASTETYIEKILATEATYLVTFEINSYFEQPWLTDKGNKASSKKRNILSSDYTNIEALVKGFLELKGKSVLFYEFWRANYDSKYTGFIVHEIQDKDKPKGSIYTIDKDYNKYEFTPFSQPAQPETNNYELNAYGTIQFNSFHMDDNNGTSSDDLTYEFRYYNKSDTESTEWIYIGEDNAYTVTDDGVYTFRVSAWGPGDYWKSPYSVESKNVIVKKTGEGTSSWLRTQCGDHEDDSQSCRQQSSGTEIRCYYNDEGIVNVPKCYYGDVVCIVPSMANGDVITDDVYVGKAVSVGTEVQYSCQPGYVLKDDENSKMTCIWKENWGLETDFPVCQLGYCRDPTYDNVLVIGDSCDDCPEAGNLYAVDTKVQMDCTTGFKNMGIQYATCNSDLEWVDDNKNIIDFSASADQVVCQEIICTSNSIENGVVHNVGEIEFENTVTYVCNDGYAINGVDQHVRTCEKATDQTAGTGKLSGGDVECTNYHCVFGSWSNINLANAQCTGSVSCNTNTNIFTVGSKLKLSCSGDSMIYVGEKYVTCEAGPNNENNWNHGNTDIFCRDSCAKLIDDAGGVTKDRREFTINEKECSDVKDDTCTDKSGMRVSNDAIDHVIVSNNCELTLDALKADDDNFGNCQFKYNSLTAGGEQAIDACLTDKVSYYKCQCS